ncbi:MAG: ABC transporter ATP-binding protein [Verrucomicrobia bacterium]|nr:ABC transporter ATP-binding protein [Verrucomicrobiota bacterium]
MVRVEHLTKRFGGMTAVDDLSFEVGRGEIVGMLGPNGAGKTTTLRMIAGFLRPTGGTISVGGRSVQDDSIEVRRRTGYMPEHAALYPEMRVAEYLRYRAALKGVPARRVRRRVSESADLCGIGPVLGRIIGRLSKGYRQRVALADALVHEPELLILDEPTLGLDPSQIRQARDLLRGLAERHTVLLSSHILPEVEMTCGRVIILHRGRLLASEPVQALARRLHRNARIIAQVQAPAEAARAELAPLAAEGRFTAEPVGAWTEIRFEAAGDDDPRPAVAAAAARRGWPLRELRREEQSLEEIFLAVTGHEARAEGAL